MRANVERVDLPRFGAILAEEDSVSLSASQVTSAIASRLDDEDIVRSTSGFGECGIRFAFQRSIEYG